MPTQTPAPETEIERAICADPDWIDGMQWGRPRPGHPEGAVGNHTLDVLANVERFAGDDDERAQLRLVALLHDCCKHQARRGGPDHGLLARRLGERYLDDERLLLVVELHDQAFRAYRRRRRLDGGLDTLLARLRDCQALDLYRQFVRCDSQTPGKSPDLYHWLSGRLDGEPEIGDGR